MRTFPWDKSNVLYHSLSILLPAAVSLSWLLREKSRQQSFYDAGYEFVPDHRVQCKRTIYPGDFGGVDYDNSCEELLGQTIGLFWEMLLIPIVMTLIFTFVARRKGLDEIVPAYTMAAWLVFAMLVAWFGFGLPLFVMFPVLIFLSLLIVLIQNR